MYACIMGGAYDNGNVASLQHERRTYVIRFLHHIPLNISLCDSASFVLRVAHLVHGERFKKTKIVVEKRISSTLIHLTCNVR